MLKDNFTINQFVNIILMIILINLSNNVCIGQTENTPYKMQSYYLSSGTHNGNGVEYTKVFNKTVHIDSAQWFRIFFSHTNLGKQSYIEILSILDSAKQRLDMKSIAEWKNTSAFFNGDAFEISLFAAPNDRNISFTINEFMIEHKAQYYQAKTRCGLTDDRVPSRKGAIGRLLYPPGTAWILESGKLATAGHCLNHATVLEFNVPTSSSNGEIRLAHPDNQYSLNKGSFIRGIDWGVFEVFPNSNTGLKPKEKQGSFFYVSQNIMGLSITIIGYGADTDSFNHTLQTANGMFVGLMGSEIMYQTDTEQGNSGSPIFISNTKNGKAPMDSVIGVHTTGGCDVFGGYNSGTNTLDVGFWEALNSPDDPDVPNINVTINQILNDDSSVDSIGRWEGGPTFIKYEVPKTFSFDADTSEVVQGTQNIISNQKYNKWNIDNTVVNHRKFKIHTGITDIISLLDYTH